MEREYYDDDREPVTDLWRDMLGDYIRSVLGEKLQRIPTPMERESAIRNAQECVDAVHDRW